MVRKRLKGRKTSAAFLAAHPYFIAVLNVGPSPISPRRITELKQIRKSEAHPVVHFLKVGFSTTNSRTWRPVQR